MYAKLNNFFTSERWIKIVGLVGFALLSFVWNYQNFYSSELNASLDNSWIIGLNWAHQLGLSWAGDSMVFTYGPLYYLRERSVFPEFYSQTQIIPLVIGLNLFYALANTYIFSIFFNQFLANKNPLDLAPAIFILLTHRLANYQIPFFVIFLLLPAILPIHNSAKPTYSASLILFIRYGVASLLFSILSLMKFSYFPLTVVIYAIFISVLLLRRSFWEALWLVGTLLFSILGLWVLILGQKLTEMPAFWISRLEMASGYTEAMQVGFAGLVQQQAFLLSILYLFILAIFFLLLLFKKQLDWALAWLLPLVVLFLNFKNVFVRADARESLILQTISLSALYYYYLIAVIQVKNPKIIEWRNSIKSITILFLLIFSLSAYSLGEMPLMPSGYFTEAGNIFQTYLYDKSTHQANLKNDYGLDRDFLNAVSKTKSIDIIPSEIGLLYAYDLRWQPRPIIQSYAAYTANLDRLDANYFASARAPEQIIYSLTSIDQRYPAFDTPQTFRTLLGQYQFVATSSDKRFALLSKKSLSTVENWVFLREQPATLGEEIRIPQVQNAHVFMSVDLQPTFIGTLFNVFYKSRPLTIQLTPRKGAPVQYRYIRATGENGLFVSKYLGNLEDVKHVFEGAYYPDLQSVRIFGSRWLYTSSFVVRFYYLPIDQGALQSPEILTRLPASSGKFLGALDINDGLMLRGWAVVADEAASESTISILLEKDGRIFRFFPTRLPRPDVSTFYKVAGLYDASGYETYLPAYDFPSGIYRLGFLVETQGKAAIHWESTPITIP